MATEGRRWAAARLKTPPTSPAPRAAKLSPVFTPDEADRHSADGSGAKMESLLPPREVDADAGANGGESGAGEDLTSTTPTVRRLEPELEPEAEPRPNAAGWFAWAFGYFAQKGDEAEPDALLEERVHAGLQEVQGDTDELRAACLELLAASHSEDVAIRCAFERWRAAAQWRAWAHEAVRRFLWRSEGDIVVRAWVRWMQFFEQALRHYIDVGRVASSTSYAAVVQVFEGWKCWTQLRTQRRLRAGRALRWHRRRAAGAALSTWRSRAGRAQGARRMARRAAQKLISGRTHRALEKWREVAYEKQVVRGLAEEVARKMELQLVVGAFFGWAHWLRRRARSRRLLGRALGRMACLQLHRAVAAWTEAAAESARLRRTAAKVVRRLRCALLTRALAKWTERTGESARLRRTAAKVVRKLRNAVLVRALEAWRAGALGQRRLRRIGRRVVQWLTQRLLAQALELWQQAALDAAWERAEQTTTAWNLEPAAAAHAPEPALIPSSLTTPGEAERLGFVWGRFELQQAEDRQGERLAAELHALQQQRHRRQQDNQRRLDEASSASSTCSSSPSSSRSWVSSSSMSSWSSAAASSVSSASSSSGSAPASTLSSVGAASLPAPSAPPPIKSRPRPHSQSDPGMAAADSAQEFAEGGKKAAALATADAAALGAALESARQEVALLRAEAVAAARRSHSPPRPKGLEAKEEKVTGMGLRSMETLERWAAGKMTGPSRRKLGEGLERPTRRRSRGELD